MQLLLDWRGVSRHLPPPARSGNCRGTARRFTTNTFSLWMTTSSAIRRARGNCLKRSHRLDIQWMSQGSLHALRDESLVRQMARSGCMGLLVGFESLNRQNLAAMGKRINKVDEYRAALDCLRRAGVFVYGTFIFGYPFDTPESFEESVRFAKKENLFLAAFNHLVPFPGTPLYRELAAAGQLQYPQWWLHEDYRFGQVPFHPAAWRQARSRRTVIGRGVRFILGDQFCAAVWISKPTARRPAGHGLSGCSTGCCGGNCRKRPAFHWEARHDFRLHFRHVGHAGDKLAGTNWRGQFSFWPRQTGGQRGAS